MQDRAARIQQGKATAAAFIEAHAWRDLTYSTPTLQEWAREHGHPYNPAAENDTQAMLESIHLFMRPSITTRRAQGRANGLRRRAEEARTQNDATRALYRAAQARGEVQLITTRQVIEVGPGMSSQNRAKIRVNAKRHRRQQGKAA